MLKVRARRTCLHGAGIDAKPALKAKEFKKTAKRVALHQDSTLITSTPRRLKTETAQDVAVLASSPVATANSSPPSALEVELTTPQRPGAVKEDLQTDTSSGIESETIFSPTFHPLKTPEGASQEGVVITDAEVSSSPDTTAPESSSPEAFQDVQVLSSPVHHYAPLLRCSLAAVTPPLNDVPGLPHEENGESEDWDVESSTDDQDTYDFDPFLFIKRLPALSEVVPTIRPSLLPKQTRRCPPKTLVLDLDETLVHSTMDVCSEADFTFPVDFNNNRHTVYVCMRPHLHSFLDRVSQLFEVTVFTASQSVYAEKLLNILDPHRQKIQHRIYRDSCVFVEGNYLKDLSVLGRDLSKVAIVDNSPQAFGFQLENGIPIESWFDDKGDSALLELLPFLESLAEAEDVRPLISSKFNLKERVQKAKAPGR